MQPATSGSCFNSIPVAVEYNSKSVVTAQNHILMCLKEFPPPPITPSSSMKIEDILVNIFSNFKQSKVLCCWNQKTNIQRPCKRKF